MSDESKRRGRPRKWTSEAERKRAYRQRRALELATPHAVRDEAQSLRAEANKARSTAERAGRQAEHWRLRAERAERRAEQAQQRTRAAEQAARRARAERDGAQRLLRNKMQWSRDAQPLRNDPDSLLALVADLRRELETKRRELAKARQVLAIVVKSE